MPYLFTLILCVLSLSALSPSLAWADEGDISTRAEQHSKRGVELYAEGRLPEAVGEMLKAYELAPEPGLLYNIARIYQKMDRRDLAVEYLKAFVTQPGADPDRVTKALQHLEELDRKAPPPPLPLPAVEAPPAEEVTTASEGASTPQASPSEGLSSGVTLEGPDHTAAWILIGGGAASLVAGGILGALALGASSDLEDATLTYEEKADAQSSARAMALGSDITIGLGVAAAIGGLVLFLLAEDPSDPIALISPTLGPERVGAAFTLRFP